VVVFLVDGTAVGSGETDAFGAARLNLNSDLGHTVPGVGAWTTISVESGGAVVASGSF